MGQIASILDCERVRESVSASVDGELSQAEAAGVQAHLASCESCRLFAAGSGETARLLRTAPREELGFTIAPPSPPPGDAVLPWRPPAPPVRTCAQDAGRSSRRRDRSDRRPQCPRRDARI